MAQYEPAQNVEIAGAVGLLIPRLSGVAALGLAGLMVGAAVTNVTILPANPALPVALLLVSALVASGHGPPPWPPASTPDREAER
jgi:hypothetical protein